MDREGLRRARREDDAHAAGIALGASLLSLLVTAAFWVLHPGVSVATVPVVVALCLGSCFAALVGFTVGLAGRHHPLGVVAIILSVPGVVASLVTLLILLVAIALAGSGAFVGTP